MEEQIISINNKITEYDLLYKKWCKKIDLILKNIVIKYENDIEKNNNLDTIVNSKIKNLEIRNQKYKKILVYLIKESKKNNSTIINIKFYSISILCLIIIIFLAKYII
jgi:cell division septal protein FtsQ